jgi:uncharacterized membrane protein YheB (UPF0754 family)
LFLIPLFGAFIGFCVVVFFLLFLFYPKQPLKLGLFIIQGLIPKYELKILKYIARRVTQYFQTEHEVTKIINNITKDEKLNDIFEILFKKILHALKNQIPMAAMLLSEHLQEKIKNLTHSEIKKLIPEMENKLTTYFVNQTDWSSIILEKILLINEQVRPLLLHSLKKKALKIAYLALVFGLIIGLIESAIIYLLFF